MVLDDQNVPSDSITDILRKKGKNKHIKYSIKSRKGRKKVEEKYRKQKQGPQV